MANNPSNTQPPQQQEQEQVQADNLLSQPDPDTEAVAEEVSLDQQADGARRVGQLPKDAPPGVEESLKSTVKR